MAGRSRNSTEKKKRHGEKDRSGAEGHREQPAREEDWAEAEQASPEEAALELAEQKIAKLEQQVEDLEDKYHRSLADLDNLRKRFQREQSRTSIVAVADFVEKLLPALDNLAHSLNAADENHDTASLIGGFKLIESQIMQIFGECGVEPIEAEGRPFDPEFHHAIVTEVTDEVPPGTVTEELGRGYKMGDLVIRPAQVKVSTRPQEGED